MVKSVECRVVVFLASFIILRVGSVDLADISHTIREGLKANSSNQTNTSFGSGGTDACQNNPCANGGTCMVDNSYINGYYCKCTQSYKGTRCNKLNCKVSLLDNTSFQCRLKRVIDIHKRKKSFNLILQRIVVGRSSRSQALDIPQMMIHSAQSFIKAASTSPFTIEWYMKMQDTINANSDTQSRFTLLDKQFHEQPTLKDFSAIYEYFYRQHRTKSAMSVLQQTPSVEANFFKDRSFVDQRFAGANVWQTYKITNNIDDNGLNWQRIVGKLNHHFDWNKAVNTVLKTDDYDAIYRAIEENRLFVSWYPELEGIALDKDHLIDHHVANKTAIRLTAPITMLVMKQTGDSENLEMVAIQADSIPEAKVFTANDGKSWFFAKALVQRADINVLQVVHKRLKSDLYLEPFCLLLERSFSEYHPIYDMLQFHCRANLETNKLYDMKLFGPSGPAYSLLSLSYTTTLETINKNYRGLSFNDVDLEADLKKRGVEDSSILPYYPFRDDARLIVKCIKSFIDRFIDLYYHHDTDVRSDKELQQWADLLSVNGNQSAPSRGMVKDFPEKIRNRQDLKTILSRLLWLATGYHSSTTFPQLEYAAFLPNAPYRIFPDDHEDAVFSNVMFGNKVKALDQVKLTSNIASSHLDKLFDYGAKLQDQKAGELLQSIVDKELVEITKKMAFANAMRVKSGHLPYPYLLPDFVTNSASS